MGAHGFGLRARHYATLLAEGAQVPVVEALTENVLGRGGRPAAVLERVAKDSVVLLHGVSLSVGGVDPLDTRFLADLRALAQTLDAPVVSDHLCFGTFGGHHGHDLWPLPHTEEALRHVCERVDQVQALLGRRFCVENISSYARFKQDTLREEELIIELCRRTGCGLLLDVNNVFVNAFNHGFRAEDFIDALPPEAVVQYHLSHHEDRQRYLFDSHEGELSAPVLALFERCVQRFGPRPAIVEWDGDVPELSVVRAQSLKAAAVLERALAGEAHAAL